MHVERKLRELAHGLDDLWREGEIRNEACHPDIDVDPIGAAFFQHRDLVASFDKSALKIDGAMRTVIPYRAWSAAVGRGEAAVRRCRCRS